MRFYTVHLPGSDVGAGDGTLGRAVLVREGFNWLAFFFAPFWALAEGLWLAAVPLIAALAAIVVVPAGVGVSGRSCRWYSASATACSPACRRTTCAGLASPRAAIAWWRWWRRRAVRRPSSATPKP